MHIDAAAFEKRRPAYPAPSTARLFVNSKWWQMLSFSFSFWERGRGKLFFALFLGHFFFFFALVLFASFAYTFARIVTPTIRRAGVVNFEACFDNTPEKIGDRMIRKVCTDCVF